MFWLVEFSVSIHNDKIKRLLDFNAAFAMNKANLLPFLSTWNESILIYLD